MGFDPTGVRIEALALPAGDGLAATAGAATVLGDAVAGPHFQRRRPTNFSPSTATAYFVTGASMSFSVSGSDLRLFLSVGRGLP